VSYQLLLFTAQNEKFSNKSRKISKHTICFQYFHFRNSDLYEIKRILCRDRQFTDNKIHPTKMHKYRLTLTVAKIRNLMLSFTYIYGIVLLNF